MDTKIKLSTVVLMGSLDFGCSEKVYRKALRDLELRGRSRGWNPWTALSIGAQNSLVRMRIDSAVNRTATDKELSQLLDKTPGRGNGPCRKVSRVLSAHPGDSISMVGLDTVREKT